METEHTLPLLLNTSMQMSDRPDLVLTPNLPFVIILTIFLQLQPIVVMLLVVGGQYGLYPTSN